MITDTFDRKTMAKMEIALERACLLLPTGSEEHNARRIIADKIIECVKCGNVSLIELTEAGYAAATEFNAPAQFLGKKFGRELKFSRKLKFSCPRPCTRA